MTANPRDVQKAEYYVEQFEGRVARARGKNVGDSYEAASAMQRVKALAQAHPDDPSVQALVERVRAALVASKGNVFQITPEMLVYRAVEQDAVALVADHGKEVFDARILELQQGGDLIDSPFPATDPWEQKIDPQRCYVHLQGVFYPKNVILDTGRQFLFVGKPSQGYYFLDLGNQNFRSIYSGIKWYENSISTNIDDEWEIIGKITGPKMAIPDPSSQPAAAAEIGWQVDVEMIQIPGRCTGFVTNAGKGEIAGASEARKLIEGRFTVMELPDDAPPEEVVSVCATAVKEKNLDLVRMTMHPVWFSTSTAEEWFFYRYEINLRRYAELYVHIEADPEVKITVLRGEKIEDDEAFFLNAEDQKSILSTAAPLVEQAEVRVRRYNERGKQEGSPAPVWLRREAGGPWRIWEGFPL